MNKLLALETEHLSPYGPCWENMEGGSFTGDFELRCVRETWRGVPLMGALEDV